MYYFEILNVLWTFAKIGTEVTLKHYVGSQKNYLCHIIISIKSAKYY